MKLFSVLFLAKTILFLEIFKDSKRIWNRSECNNRKDWKKGEKHVPFAPMWTELHHIIQAAFRAKTFQIHFLVFILLPFFLFTDRSTSDICLAANCIYWRYRWLETYLRVVYKKSEKNSSSKVPQRNNKLQQLLKTKFANYCDVNELLAKILSTHYQLLNENIFII